MEDKTGLKELYAVPILITNYLDQDQHYVNKGKHSLLTAGRATGTSTHISLIYIIIQTHRSQRLNL